MSVLWTIQKKKKLNGRLCDILRTMREKAIETLALSEVGWLGHGPLVGNRKKMRRGIGIADLEYADDMAPVCGSVDALEEMHRHSGLPAGLGD